MGRGYFPDFRIFIDAATLKVRWHFRTVPRVPNFRIFIDAATLKGHPRAFGGFPRPRFPHLYRCGHIEGTLIFASMRRTLRFPHLYRCGHIEGLKLRTRRTSRARYFRIFIDAATLKDSTPGYRLSEHARFPHLYRCGHIEGKAARISSHGRKIISASL